MRDLKFWGDRRLVSLYSAMKWSGPFGESGPWPAGGSFIIQVLYHTFAT